MRPVSPRFLASMRTSHVVANRCEILFPGETVPVTVPVKGGQVTCDRTSQNRRSGTIEIPWSLEQGESMGLDLRTLPLGGYATIRHGVHYGDTTDELVTLGVLRVESVSWKTLGGTANLELADRMAQVRDEPFIGPFSAAGMQPAEAAVAIVTEVFGSTIDYLTPHDPTMTLGDTIFTGQRTEALTSLEQTGDGETYFDADGNFVYDHRAGDTDPVWTVDAGQDGVLVDATESLDRTGVYNGVLVTAQQDMAVAPVYGLATDDDPSSPTLWGGPFGKVALEATSNVSTEAEAEANAASLLNLRLKMTRVVQIVSAPNPALEAGDVITVVYPDGRTEQQLVDGTTIDLATGAQTIGTRNRFTPTTTSTLTPTKTRPAVLAWSRE